MPNTRPKTLQEQIEDSVNAVVHGSTVSTSAPAGTMLHQSNIAVSDPDVSTSSTQQNTQSVSGTRWANGYVPQNTPYITQEQDTQKGGILYNLGTMYRDRQRNLERGINDEIARQQRMARASAWGEFIKAIGNLAGGAAGGGSAPLPMQYDPSRTLAAFQAVDRLRAEQRNMDNDPMLSWLRNAQLGRMTALDNQRLEAQRYDKQLQDRMNMEQYSASSTSGDTNRVTMQGNRRTDTYVNPESLLIKSGAGSGSGKEAFTYIGKTDKDQNGVPIRRDQALSIIQDVINVYNGYGSRFVSPDNQQEITSIREIASEYGKQLSNLMSAIKGAPAEVQDNVIRSYVEQIASYDKTNMYARWASQNQMHDNGSDNIADLGLTD